MLACRGHRHEGDDVRQTRPGAGPYRAPGTSQSTRARQPAQHVQLLCPSVASRPHHGAHGHEPGRGHRAALLRAERRSAADAAAGLQLHGSALRSHAGQLAHNARHAGGLDRAGSGGLREMRGGASRKGQAAGEPAGESHREAWRAARSLPPNRTPLQCNAPLHLSTACPGPQAHHSGELHSGVGWSKDGRVCGAMSQCMDDGGCEGPMAGVHVGRRAEHGRHAGCLHGPVGARSIAVRGYKRIDQCDRSLPQPAGAQAHIGWLWPALSSPLWPSGSKMTSVTLSLILEKVRSRGVWRNWGSPAGCVGFRRRLTPSS